MASVTPRVNKDGANMAVATAVYVACIVLGGLLGGQPGVLCGQAAYAVLLAGFLGVALARRHNG